MSELSIQIDKYYTSLRYRAESRAEKYLSMALSDPDFSTLEKKFQRARIAYLRSENEFPEQKDEFEKQYREARAERRDILKRLGLTERDLIPNYQCPHCKDTGFLENGSSCQCYRQLVKKLKFEEIGITSIPFASFEEADQSLVPQINYKYYQVKYCGAFPSVPLSTVFTGETGTGKTFLASCIAGELEKNGKSVMFLSAFSLNRFFMSCFEQESYRSLSLLSDCDLLIIDDLGAEPVYKKITVEYLKLVLDERFAKKMPVLITTNLDRDGVFNRYGERIYSRIFDQSSLDENNLFTGKDLRTRR